MKFALIVAATVLLAATPLAAQDRPGEAAPVTFPEGPRGALARQWVEIYNGFSVPEYRKFMEAHAEDGDTPISARVARYGDMQGNLGKLTVLEARETEEGIELRVRTAHCDTGIITVMISPKAPYKFQAVRVEI